MKRKLLLLLTLCVPFIFGKAQAPSGDTCLYHQTFDSIPDDWSFSEYGWNWTSGYQYYEEVISGSGPIIFFEAMDISSPQYTIETRTASDGCVSSDGSLDYFISPLFQLPDSSYRSWSVSFDLRAFPGKSHYDFNHSLSVMVTTDNGTTWEENESWSSLLSWHDVDNYNTITLNLDDYLEDSIRIAFFYPGTAFSHTLYLDNFSVTASATSYPGLRSFRVDEPLYSAVDIHMSSLEENVQYRQIDVMNGASLDQSFQTTDTVVHLALSPNTSYLISVMNVYDASHSSVPVGHLIHTDNRSWSYSSGNLSIDLDDITCVGRNSLPDMKPGEAPWFEYATEIESIYLTGSFQYIGKNVFHGLKNVKNVYFMGQLMPGYAYQTSMVTSRNSSDDYSWYDEGYSLDSIHFTAFDTISKAQFHLDDIYAPPVVVGMTREPDWYSNSILYIPSDSNLLAEYATAPYWRMFGVIRGNDVEVEIKRSSDLSTVEDSVQLSWNPISGTAEYQLTVYVASTMDEVGSITIAADSMFGFIVPSAASPVSHRVKRIVLDDIGSVVIIRIDPSSGFSAGSPIVVNITGGVERNTTYLFSLKAVDLNENLIERKDGSFVIDPIPAITTDLELMTSELITPYCYDLQGNKYSFCDWSSLPFGIYIVYHDGFFKKLIKH